ncbi:MarR family winged helix-turn-helix transcriptional regulator [Microbacterium sp.]|uniref:MarR family winged helix-turn-helix transcriptional regulator n=1 Tax=Microbacterium sp. TaxID=51671 RepID=UPI003C749F46
MNEDTREARTESRRVAVRALEGEFSALIAQMRRVLAENAQRVSPGMLPGAYKVFTTIVRRQRIAQSALADLLVVDKGQLSRAVRELEQLGLIRREPDPSDRRASILSPTELGMERLEAAREPQERTLLEVLDDWPLEEIHSLTRLLHALTSGVVPGHASDEAHLAGVRSSPPLSGAVTAP